ncbi:WD40 repeat domain-containing protein [Campylobacter mucosalis]|uniref:WD40 repeat domain-containing protein n=1 Tax=Campylobacter mucosalis TaxID=202 RepID=UPI0014706AEA|nr:WD40 repeat domain-containing protein [Campylobacter mucosalis]
MRVILFILTIFGFMFATEPFMSIQTKSNVMGITYINDKIYIATQDGVLEIYDTKSASFKSEVKFQSTNDSEIKPQIISVDEYAGALAVLVEQDYGKKFLYVIAKDDKKTYDLGNEGIKRAMFVNDKTVVLASISNEIYFFNLKTANIDESFKISTAMLSDMKMDPSRKTLVISAESGNVYFYDLQNRAMKRIVELHKDNMYSISYKNDVVISSGVDKSIGVFRNDEVRNLRYGDSAVLGVALSPDGNIGAYFGDDLSNVHIFNTKDLKSLNTINTPQTTINGMAFLSQNVLVTSAFDKNIYFWKVK